MSAETDLYLLKQYTKHSEYDQDEIMRCVRLLARRQYFNYDMVLSMLKILYKAKSKIDESPCIWLLLAAKHRSFFGHLNSAMLEVLDSIGNSQFFTSMKLFFKKSNNVRFDTFMEEFGETELVFINLPKILQADIMYQYSDTYIFTAWCGKIAPLVRQLLVERTGMDIGLLVVTLCSSEYFENNISNEEVDKFIKILLEHGDTGLEYIRLFFMAARSPGQIFTAKRRIFHFLSILKISDEEAAAMNKIVPDYASICSKIAEADLAEAGTVNRASSDHVPALNIAAIALAEESETEIHDGASMLFSNPGLYSPKEMIARRLNEISSNSIFRLVQYKIIRLS